ncbi:hypothetical protein PROFUN_09964 [Planoprotostelium fungivorum]|uniref:F-box domain-containing protein n=1 Tax=Planoprotostelium fungivorum TaxID=1890364 RepID=A0A2P6NFJ3_9EUKA|nr:hypothetical protein PROFUN_09964 [Planoprotostelium fungivorum]
MRFTTSRNTHSRHSQNIVRTLLDTTATETKRLKDCVQTYEEHRQHKTDRQKHMKERIQNLRNGEIVILSDFKEDISLMKGETAMRPEGSISFLQTYPIRYPLYLPVTLTERKLILWTWTKLILFPLLVDRIEMILLSSNPLLNEVRIPLTLVRRYSVPYGNKVLYCVSLTSYFLTGNEEKISKLKKTEVGKLCQNFLYFSRLRNQPEKSKHLFKAGLAYYRCSPDFRVVGLEMMDCLSESHSMKDSTLTEVETLEKIFQFVGVRGVMISCRAVCRLWYHTSQRVSSLAEQLEFGISTGQSEVGFYRQDGDIIS